MTRITPAAKTWWVAYGRTRTASDGRALPVVLHYGVVKPGGSVSIGQPTIEQFTSEAPWRLRIRALGGAPLELEDEAAEPDQAPADPYARLAHLRWEREVGGLTRPDGRTVRTTRESRSQLTTALSAYDQGLVSGRTDWKLEGGWVVLDQSDLRAMTAAVSRHVQACFGAERDVETRLDSIDDPWTANIAALFRDAYDARMR